MESLPQTISTESSRSVEFEFDQQQFQASRILGDWGNSELGPTLVFFGALHGNERSGVVALLRLFDELKSKNIQLRGRIVGLTGNLAAVEQNRRYLDLDLNRIWTRNRLNQKLPDSDSAETREQNELNVLINEIMDSKGEKFFFDLHTTSSDSTPFIAINDQMANRDFAIHFPVSIIFGIEEYLQGPLLSYLNDYGHVAFAFEAGEHEDPHSATMHLSFIKLAMVHAGIVGEPSFIDQEAEQEILGQKTAETRGFFEITYREEIKPDDQFRMLGHFDNFQRVKKNQVLAQNKSGELKAPQNGRVFMPLYQSEGSDGFFIVRSIPGWALWLSRFLRKINFDRWLTWLPGVSSLQGHPETLVVNKRIAFLLRNQLFHLLGYRRKQEADQQVIYLRREIVQSVDRSSTTDHGSS